MKKNIEIERLRGVAILLVLLQHLSISSAVFSTLGFDTRKMPFYLGVHIFFVISGYVVAKSFISKGLNVKLFYAKRIFRILPLIVFFVVLSAFLNIFRIYFSVQWKDFFQDSAAVLGGYFVSPFYKTHGIYNFGAMWSLSVEMQFYLVFLLLMVICIKLCRLGVKRLLLFFGILYMSIAVILRLAMAGIITLKLPALLQHISIWKFDFLVLGVLLCLGNTVKGKYLITPSNTRRRLLNLLYPALIIVPCIISYLSGSVHDGYRQSWFLNTAGFGIFGISFFVLLSLAIRGQDLITVHPLIDRVLAYFGSRSYSLYVLHFPSFVIIWICLNLLTPKIFSISPVYYTVAQTLMFIAVGVPMAEFAHRYIEKPGIRLGDLIISRYNIGGTTANN